MDTHTSEKGFSLIEVLVAVAIVAIVAGAITPLVLKYVGDARSARAISDARTMGQAIIAFNLDTGRWPVSDDGNLGDASELSRLVGLARGDISAGNIPDGAGTATGDGNWDGGGDGGKAGKWGLPVGTGGEDQEGQRGAYGVGQYEAGHPIGHPHRELHRR